MAGAGWAASVGAVADRASRPPGSQPAAERGTEPKSQQFLDGLRFLFHICSESLIKETAELFAFAEAVPAIWPPIAGTREPGPGGRARGPKAGAAKPVVLSPTRRPEMAPQAIEKADFAPRKSYGVPTLRPTRSRASGHGADEDQTSRASSGQPNCIFSSIRARRPEMAPQGIEKTGSAPGKGWRPELAAHKISRPAVADAQQCEI